jgi:hypothetical protein
MRWLQQWSLAGKAMIQKIVIAVANVIEALLPLIPEDKHLEALDAIGEWLKRRRVTIDKHQQRLDERRKP